MSADMDYERRRWKHGCHPDDPHLVDVTAGVEAMRDNRCGLPSAHYTADVERQTREVLVTIPRWWEEELPHSADAGHFQSSINHKLLDMGKQSAGATLTVGPSITARINELRLIVRMDE